MSAQDAPPLRRYGALMTLHFRPAGVPDYSLADVVVQKLRERGYL